MAQAKARQLLATKSSELFLVVVSLGSLLGVSYHDTL